MCLPFVWLAVSLAYQWFIGTRGFTALNTMLKPMPITLKTQINSVNKGCHNSGKLILKKEQRTRRLLRKKLPRIASIFLSSKTFLTQDSILL